MARTPLGEAFGLRLRNERLARGWSQAVLARRSRLHWTWIGQLERGDRTPNLRSLLAVAYGLDIDPGDLLAGIDPECYLKAPPGPGGVTD